MKAFPASTCVSSLHCPRPFYSNIKCTEYQYKGDNGLLESRVSSEDADCIYEDIVLLHSRLLLQQKFNPFLLVQVFRQRVLLDLFFGL